MITMAAIATFAPVLRPFEGAAATRGAGEGVTEAEATGPFWELAAAAGIPGVGAPDVGVPHLPQNCTLSLTLDPQFLQNVLMFGSIDLSGARRMEAIRLVRPR
jgi:hypothetical protein